MKDQAGGVVNDTKGRSKKSAWMSHWMQTNRNAAVETRNYAATRNVQPDNTGRDDNLRTGLDVSRSVEGLRVVETKSFGIMNASARASHNSLENQGMQSSFSKNDRVTGSMRAPRPLSHGKAIHHGDGTRVPSVIDRIPDVNSSGAPRFLDEGSSKNPRDLSSVRDIGFPTPKPLQETYVESSSQTVPYRFNVGKYDSGQGKATIPSLTNRPTIFSNNQPSDIVRKRKTDTLLQSENPKDACFREINTPLLLDAPSTSDNHLPPLGQEWFQETKKYSSFSLFPSPGFGSENAKSKEPDFNHYSLAQNCVHDVEAMRICTTLDSVKGLPGGFPIFSHTTHSLVITKKTDVGLPMENDVLRSTRVVSKINGNTSNDFCSLSPFLTRGNRGVKLQSLSSSTDSEAKEGNVGNAESSKAIIKNESSEETDTLDMDSLMENNLLQGANSAPSAKLSSCNNEKLPPQLEATSSREVGRQWRKTGLPDINVELPALPAAAGLMENACPSSSRTQSLDLEFLAALPKTKSKVDDSLEADPSSRWVKRLKLSSSNSSSHGTKMPTLPENSSHEKMSKFFSRIIKNNINSSEVALMDRETSLPDKSGNILKETQDFPEDPAMKGKKELLLRHAWIQRWLCEESRITRKKPQAMVVCEPQSSKVALEDIEKKQFPSIAAMALMGKAMNGFQQCELQKRGSFTVWNSKAF